MDTKTVTLFLKWNTNIKLLSQSRCNKSITFFNDLFKSIEIYIYAKNKSPFTSCFAAKDPEHSKFAVTDMREKPVDFFY